jgi:hypothetical protein
LTWNIDKGLVKKLENDDFISIISAYDIICLTECWISNDVIVDIHGYEGFTFTRKCGIGGGIIVLFKSALIDNINIKQNCFDSIIWLEVSSGKTDIKPIYIALCYIPPIRSVFYDKIDVDLFQVLEDTASKYMCEGSVYITGDLNARCGNNEDFIADDVLGQPTYDCLQPVLNYVPDTVLNGRATMDSTVNQFGRKLLAFCKTTGLRIVNGRHVDDPNGSVTFSGHNTMVSV